MIELLRTPTWLVGRMNDMPEDEKIEPPPIATLPQPTPAAPLDDNDPAVIIATARSLVNQFKADQAAKQLEIQRMQVDLAEMTMQLESEKRKNAVLEADLAESHNNVQALEAQLQDYKQTFQGIRHRLDQHGITPPEKNGKRNGNGNGKKK